MAFAPIQNWTYTTAAGTSEGSSTVTLGTSGTGGVNPTPGNTFVAVVCTNCSNPNEAVHAVGSFVQQGGNNWSPVQFFAGLSVWALTVPPSPPANVVVTYGAGGTDFVSAEIIIYEFPPAFVDLLFGNNGSPTVSPWTTTTGSGTAHEKGAILLAAGACEDSVLGSTSPITGYTNDYTSGNHGDGGASFGGTFQVWHANAVTASTAAAAVSMGWTGGGGTENVVAVLVVVAPALSFVPSQIANEARVAKPRYNDAFSVASGVRIVGPSPVNTRFQPPVEFFPHGRYHPEGWTFSSGVKVVGPQPQPSFSTPPLDASVQRRYNSEGWSWVGRPSAGPSPTPYVPALDGMGQGRYNRDLQFFATGVRVVGPAQPPRVPNPDFLLVQRRYIDGWYYAFVSPTQGPTPQALATVMDAFVKARYNANGWSVSSGVLIIGPQPHFVPPPTEIRTKPRYNAEGWYSFFGNGISGPQPGPTTKNVALSDIGATVSETVRVSKPTTGGGPYIVQFFRPL